MSIESTEHKVERVEILLTREQKAAASRRARMQGRPLASIMRAWLIGWADGRFPDPDNIQEGIVSAKRGRKPGTRNKKPAARK